MGKGGRRFMFSNRKCSGERNSPYCLPSINYKTNVLQNREVLSTPMQSWSGGPGPPSPASIFTSPRKPVRRHNPHLWFRLSSAVALISLSDTSLVIYDLCYRKHPFPEVKQEIRQTLQSPKDRPTSKKDRRC